MTRPKLSFYTNIPTPNQNDFFTALSAHFALTVIYYAKTERNRLWSLTDEPRPYTIIWLQDSQLARWLQRWINGYHFSRSILRVALNDNADYVIVSGAYWMLNTIVAMLVARWRGKEVAFFGERLAGEPTGWKAVLKRFLLWPLRISCSRIFAVGQEAADTYRTFGLKATMTVVPYNINTSRYATKRSLTDTFTLLSAGSLIPRKGMDTVIRAVKGLTGQGYEHLRLQIVGEGIERTELQRLIGNDNRIELVGFKEGEELINHFRRADTFVFASRYDGWGVVINEAIAAGLPIISSETVGATRQWVQPGVNGFTCPPDDVDGFRNAIRQLVNEPTLRQQQATFNQQLSQQTSSEQYARVVYEIVLNDLGL
ncbi:glycosyltransferase family 4 protein [Spirosoma soli]|uniref:Glycosyltransferase family 4 protein n=1 Tax=Spirosoma soli TaxID=1770529 RepID=A0ABW5M9W9_9BACT